MLFDCAPWRGLRERAVDALFSFAGWQVLTRMLRDRLECLGWKVISVAQADDGSWFLLAESCGHTIVSLADTKDAVWSLACSMALKLTMSGGTSPEDVDDRR